MKTMYFKKLDSYGEFVRTFEIDETEVTTIYNMRGWFVHDGEMLCEIEGDCWFDGDGCQFRAESFTHPVNFIFFEPREIYDENGHEISLDCGDEKEIYVWHDGSNYHSELIYDSVDGPNEFFVKIDENEFLKLSEMKVTTK